MTTTKPNRLPYGILPITDLRRPYTPMEQTDVQDTWRRHGWVPPSETTHQAGAAPGDQDV